MPSAIFDVVWGHLANLLNLLCQNLYHSTVAKKRPNSLSMARLSILQKVDTSSPILGAILLLRQPQGESTSVAATLASHCVDCPLGLLSFKLTSPSLAAAVVSQT